MKSRFLFLLLATLALATSPALAQSRSSANSRWEQSLVTLDITRQQYDYFQPWTKRPKTVVKNGIVVGPNEILTTADELADRTLIRVQKGGRGKWATADLVWIDYHANLALVTSKDKDFWTGLKPVELAATLPAKWENIQLARWRNGNLEIRKMEFNQFAVDDAKLSYASYMQLELSSEINGVGWAEPIVAGGKVVGLSSSQNGNTCRAIPTPFIKSILEARKKGTYRGLGSFEFVWHPAENPATLKYLKAPSDSRGVIIVQVPKRAGAEQLRARDLILQVDGFEIDTEGYYRDPEYGNLSLEALSTRKKWAGDTVPLKVWRDGAELNVTYKLPAVDYSSKLVPDRVFDQEPEYLIAGGLTFQPLSNELLRGWGDDWRRRAPFRLSYYNNEERSADRPAVLLLTNVLPDPITIGYQEYRYLAVDKVNGRKVSRLPELVEALQKPVDGFHTIQFVKGDSVQKIVLDASDLDGATKRVLQRFGIAKDRVINQTTAAK